MIPVLREPRKKNLPFWSMHLTNQDGIEKFQTSFNVEQKPKKLRPPVRKLFKSCLKPKKQLS